MHLSRLLFHARVTEEAIREHADVLVALKAGDPETAHGAMERHILFSQRRPWHRSSKLWNSRLLS
jgi:DNA-binding FadR family transcriptional regulator